MAKFNKGDKVRIIDVDKIGGADAYFKNGDTTHIISVAPGGYPYLYCNDGDYVDGLFVTDRECNYIELATDKPSKSERISLLESQVADLTAKVEALQKPKYVFGIDLAKPSPNEQRKTVIERAKAFIEEAKVDLSFSRGKGYVLGEIGRVCDVQFIVNNDKRTVVALFRWRHDGNVYAKAIAKCAPDDVFNADIGKAIALGRALGLDVSEFENAVKPTEVVVGMKAEIRGNIQPYVKTIISGNYGQYHSVEGIKRNKDRLLRITDDTEAQY